MRTSRGWRLVGAAILTLFFVEAVHQFIPAVYAKNIDALRLGPSVLSVLLFLAPLAFIARRTPSAARLMVPFGITVVAFRLLLALPLGLDGRLAFGGLTVAAYMLFLPAFLTRGLGQGSASLDGAAFATGFVVDATARSLFLGVDPLVTGWGFFPTFALGAVALFVLRREARGTVTNPTATPEPLGMRDVLRAGILGLALGALLGLQLTLLAHPSVLARFASASLPATTIAVLAGLGFGIALVLRGLSPSPRWFLVGNAFVIVAVVDLAWAASPIFPALVAIAELVFVLDVALLFTYLRRAPSLRATGLAFGVAGLVLILYLFAFVFALAYAFVPGRALWEGQLPVFLLLAALAVAVPAIAVAFRSRRHGLRVGAASVPLTRAMTAGVTALLLLAGAASLVVPTPETPIQPATITAMAYNIHQGFGQDGSLDLERIREVIRAANADVVALQESDTARISSGNQDAVRFLAAQLGYYEAYGPPTRDQIFGVAILSRFPIVGWRTVPLPSLDAQRVAVEAQVQVGARTVTVVAVHLGLLAAERALQLTFLKQQFANVASPTILLGDFNSCPNGQCPGVADADAIYAGLIEDWEDAWTGAGHDVMDASGFSWPAASPNRRIDYVFASGLSAESATVPRDDLARVASDHLPVVARLLFP